MLLPGAAAWAVSFAFTASEWATVIAVIVGAGGLGSFMTSAVALKRNRDLRHVEVKSVASQETDTALRVLGGVVVELRTELDGCKVELDECRQWRTQHIEMCPIFRRRR